jgi:hypothetical protein
MYRGEKPSVAVEAAFNAFPRDGGKQLSRSDVVKKASGEPVSAEERCEDPIKVVR